MFVFDDQLDDGVLGHKKEEAMAYIDSMIAIFDDNQGWEEKNKSEPIRDVLKDIWERILRVI